MAHSFQAGMYYMQYSIFKLVSCAMVGSCIADMVLCSAVISCSLLTKKSSTQHLISKMTKSLGGKPRLLLDCVLQLV